MLSMCGLKARRRDQLNPPLRLAAFLRPPHCPSPRPPRARNPMTGPQSRCISTPGHSLLDPPDDVERPTQPAPAWQTSIELRWLKRLHRLPYAIQRHEVRQLLGRPQHQRRYAVSISDVRIKTVSIEANVFSETSPDLRRFRMNDQLKFRNSYYAGHGPCRVYPDQRSRLQSNYSVPQFNGLVSGDNKLRVTWLERNNCLTHGVFRAKASSVTRRSFS